MEERPEDPIEAVRNLFEREEGLVGAGTDDTVQPMVIKPALDNRYFTVKGLRKKTGHGKDWAEAGEAVAVERASFLVPDDDRLLFNSNSFSLEKGRNVSRSFDLDGSCVTCQTGPHSAFEGRDGKPVVFCLADQHFSPAAPAADGKECMRILRVEDASLRELTSEFLDWLNGKELVVGCVVLLGSVYQLSVDGTAQYVDDWHHCQRRLKEAVEGLLVLPLIPIPLEGVKDKETVRSLLEFFLWFEDLPDVEAKLMADTREDLKKSFLGRISEGPGWCDDRQSLRLPLSLNGQGKATKANRLLGNRPKTIVAFGRDLEREWMAKMAEDLNKGFNLGLSSDLMLYRTAEDLCRARGDEERMAAVVFGASNGTRLAEVLKENGINVSCSATPGWRLAGQRVKEMEDRIKQMGKDEVLVLYGLDASVFVEVEDDMRSGPPRVGKDGRYHLRGKLTVVTGMQLEVLLENITSVLAVCGDRQVIIVTPSPRFWIQCCRRHAPRGDEAQVREDKERLLRELGKFRRALTSLLMKLRLTRSVRLVNPLEVLNVSASVAGIESLMIDQVHWLSGCYNMIAAKVVEEMAGWKAGKRRLTLDSSQASKKPRGVGGSTGRGGGAAGKGRGRGVGERRGGKSFASKKKW